MDQVSRIADLVARGAFQISARYRAIFVPPKGETALEALRRVDPDEYQYLVNEHGKALERAAVNHLGVMAANFPPGKTFREELTPDEWREFKLLTTGKAPFTTKDRTACPHCRTLGHIHRTDCPNHKVMP